MKTNLKFTIIALFTISSFIFVSCDKTDDMVPDTVKPTISLTEPEEGQNLKIGSTTGVHFEVDLADDVMLKSYKIEIHNNFDHHSHGTRAASSTIPFTFNKAYDVTGKRTAHIHHHEIIIPANAAPGDYHFMLYCTDAAGNESFIARNIVLSTTAAEDVD